MLQESFGIRVKELRDEKLMSQLELAKKSNIDRTTISKIEKGKINVTLETIEKLSFALNITVSELMNINSTYNVKPFVKWAGGKGQIIDKLKNFMPTQYNDYYEPFVGGGALLFSVAPKKAYINDSNNELICAYNCFKNEESYNLLINELLEHEKNHSEEYYYMIRDEDKKEGYTKLPDYKRASRMIYLNKACFNGLYRVNSSGYFNVPWGQKEKINTFDRNNIFALKNYFDSNTIQIQSSDFEEAVKSAKKNDFVYFDPPYDTYDDKNSFTAYSKNDFGKEEQIRLSKVFKDLTNRGVYVMLSNHNTEFINDLYKDYNIHVIGAKRIINSKFDGRGEVEEVIITNY